MAPRLDGRREKHGMPVGWVNVSGPAPPTGAAGAHDSLRSVLTYTGADIVEAACVRIPVARSAVGDDGLVDDAAARAGAAAALATLAARVRDNARAARR